MGDAKSEYRGLRITVTQNPGSDRMWVTLAVKQVHGRWDDWALLFPAIPTDVPSETPPLLADVIAQAMHVLEVALEQT